MGRPEISRVAILFKYGSPRQTPFRVETLRSCLYFYGKLYPVRAWACMVEGIWLSVYPRCTRSDLQTKFSEAKVAQSRHQAAFHPGTYEADRILLRIPCSGDRC